MEQSIVHDSLVISSTIGLAGKYCYRRWSFFFYKVETTSWRTPNWDPETSIVIANTRVVGAIDQFRRPTPHPKLMGDTIPRSSS